MSNSIEFSNAGSVARPHENRGAMKRRLDSCSRSSAPSVFSESSFDLQCFYISDASELENWQVEAKEVMVDKSGHMLFEITDAPMKWSCDIGEELTPAPGPSTSYTSDEEFELL